MKKYLVILILFFSFTPVLVSAQSRADNCAQNRPSAQLCNPVTTTDSLVGFVMQIIQVFATFFGIMAIIYVIYSGFRMMISQGDSEALTVAKSAFMWSLFGLVLGMFAFVLITATGNFIGARDPDKNSYIGNNDVRNPLIANNFYDLLITMITGFLSIAGFIAVLMIIIGGYRYITSAGNDELAESGKKTLQWALIGLIVIILSYTIVRSTATLFGN